MSGKQFRAVTRPKVLGAMNLHAASSKKQLDFFVSLSSLVATTGMPGQTNYCAANNFLDEFARFRHTLGLPATTIQLGMITEVGVVSQNDVARVSLERNGFYPIPESEFLQLIASAFQTQEYQSDWASDRSAQSLIVTGLEPKRLRELMESKKVDTAWHHEPRFNRLMQSVEDLATSESGTSSTDKSISAKSLLEEKNPEAFLKGVQTVVTARVARLLFISPEEIDPLKGFSDYGLDSMIAAEFRIWLAKEWGYDISFLDLISAGSNVRKVAEGIMKKKGL